MFLYTEYEQQVMLFSRKYCANKSNLLELLRDLVRTQNVPKNVRVRIGEYHIFAFRKILCMYQIDDP